MLYTDRFISTDNLITHLKSYLITISDPIVKANYAGFLSVSSITVYELAIKDIFNIFATKKNRVFGIFVDRYFNRINGRIMIDDLRGDHIKRFGEKYLKKFDGILLEKENNILTSSRVSIKSNYSNLILCRHKFVHTGSPTLTVDEVMANYEYGKEVIHCLSNTMSR